MVGKRVARCAGRLNHDGRRFFDDHILRPVKLHSSRNTDLPGLVPRRLELRPGPPLHLRLRLLPHRLRSCAHELLLTRLVPIWLHDRLLKPRIREHSDGDSCYMLPNVC